MQRLQYPQTPLAGETPDLVFHATTEDAMAHTITRSRQGCLATYVGHVTFEEFLRVVQAIQAHDNYDAIRHVLHDLSAVTALDLSQVNLGAFMSHELGARYTNPKICTAVVSLDTAMQAMIQVCNARTHLGIGLFSSVPQALDWLQLRSMGADAGMFEK